MSGIFAMQSKPKEALRGDSKLIVTAASAAQKAADYIRGIQAGEAASE